MIPARLTVHAAPRPENHNRGYNHLYKHYRFIKLESTKNLKKDFAHTNSINHRCKI